MLINAERLEQIREFALHNRPTQPDIVLRHRRTGAISESRGHFAKTFLLIITNFRLFFPARLNVLWGYLSDSTSHYPLWLTGKLNLLYIEIGGFK
jgi:hypothetical protein